MTKKKGCDPVSEKDKQIMETFGRIVPHLSERDKEKLLAFGEGVAIAVEKKRRIAGQDSA